MVETSSLPNKRRQDSIVALLAINLVVNLVWAWNRQFNNLDGNPNLIGLFSFRVDDPPWMPSDVAPSKPLIGLHHFGDLTLGLGYGATSNPYVNDYPSQVPPLGVYFLRLMGIFGYEAGFWAFLVLTIGTISISGIFWLKNWSFSQQTTFLALGMFLTLPALTNYDRGSLALAAIGLAGCSLIAASKGLTVLSTALFVLAISIKPYLAIVLLVPLLRGYLKYVIAVVVATLIPNLLLLLTFEGSLRATTRGFVEGVTRYTGRDAEWIWIVQSSQSLSGLLSRVAQFAGLPGASEMALKLSSFALLLGSLWLVLVSVAIMNRRLPDWVAWVLVLSATMVATPSSFLYTTAWACLGAFLFVTERELPFPRRVPIESAPTVGNDGLSKTSLRILRAVVLLMLVGNLTPHTWSIPSPWGSAVSAVSMVPGMTVVLGTMAVLTVLLVDRRRSTSFSAHA